MTAYLMAIILYNSLFNRNLAYSGNPDVHNSNIYTLEIPHYCFGFLMMVGANYFIFLEINKLKQSKTIVIMLVLTFHFLVVSSVFMAFVDFYFFN